MSKMKTVGLWSAAAALFVASSFALGPQVDTFPKLLAMGLAALGGGVLTYKMMAE